MIAAELYFPNVEIEYAKSGRVPSIVYITLPMVDWYSGVLVISASFSNGHKWVLTSMGV
jgi:hypothetical protein